MPNGFESGFFAAPEHQPVFALPSGIAYSGTELMISNYEVDVAEDIALLTLRPYEARVYRLT